MLPAFSGLDVLFEQNALQIKDAVDHHLRTFDQSIPHLNPAPTFAADFDWNERIPSLPLNEDASHIVGHRHG
jgi:hypothetical protein